MMLSMALLACNGRPAGAGDPPPATPLADVVVVSTTGTPGDYVFEVTVKSPDTGCDQFADWWEVASTDGALLYRRVLLHSHVDQQPFTRTGGPVPVQPDDILVVRAHLSTGGYGGSAMRGSVSGGFATTAVGADWAAGLASRPPLPEGCAW